MIEIIPNSVFESKCEMIVNTVNCNGVMGAGIALEFSLRYPEMFKTYKNECSIGQIRIGETKMYECRGQKILNFPTKGCNEREKSKIKYIVDGLLYFINHYKEYGIKSIAFPLLGCANGHLDFEGEVKTLMINYLSRIKDLDIKICTNEIGPQGLELKMTNYIKQCDILSVLKNLDLENEYENIKTSIEKISRFSQLASSRYLKSEEIYRKIWNYVYERVV